eukprot:7693906-Alexandrium_andersonii.AAC.1
MALDKRAVKSNWPGMHRWGRALPTEGVAPIRGAFVCGVCGLECNRLRLYGSVCQGDLDLALRSGHAAK